MPTLATNLRVRLPLAKQIVAAVDQMAPYVDLIEDDAGVKQVELTGGTTV